MKYLYRLMTWAVLMTCSDLFAHTWQVGFTDHEKVKASTHLFNSTLSSQGETTDCQAIYRNVVFCGAKPQREQLFRWLGLIAQTKVGKQFLEEIGAAKSCLLIVHDDHYLTLSVAGRTQFEATSAVTDGRGSDAVILFNFSIPDEGAHLVWGSNHEMIAFDADTNLFHELAHAKHVMNGTFVNKYEVQAISDENQYRRERAELDQQALVLRDEFEASHQRSNLIWQP